MGGSNCLEGSNPSLSVPDAHRPEPDQTLVALQLTLAGWAVLEWECALKHPEDGAREGAEYIQSYIIRVTERAFDDFAGAGTDRAANRKMLGL